MQRAAEKSMGKMQLVVHPLLIPGQVNGLITPSDQTGVVLFQKTLVKQADDVLNTMIQLRHYFTFLTKQARYISIKQTVTTAINMINYTASGLTQLYP